MLICISLIINEVEHCFTVKNNFMSYLICQPFFSTEWLTFFFSTLEVLYTWSVIKIAIFFQFFFCVSMFGKNISFVCFCHAKFFLFTMLTTLFPSGFHELSTHVCSYYSYDFFFFLPFKYLMYLKSLLIFIMRNISNFIYVTMAVQFIPIPLIKSS